MEHILQLQNLDVPEETQESVALLTITGSNISLLLCD